MPKVICPGCQTLLAYDPQESTEFACPQCHQRLRVAPPKPRPPTGIPVARPTSAPSVVEEPPEDEAEDEVPVRRKKRKKFSKPSGRVSPLLMPLGGGAVFLIVASALGGLASVWHSIPRPETLPSLAVGLLIVAFALAVHIGVGGAALTMAVNGVSPRKRVPSIDFVEGVCLYPILTAAGLLGGGGVGLAILLPMLAAFSGPNAPKELTVAFAACISVCFILALVAWHTAASAAVKLLLNTSWSDARVVVTRYIGIACALGFVVGMALNVVFFAIGVAVGAK